MRALFALLLLLVGAFVLIGGATGGLLKAFGIGGAGAQADPEHQPAPSNGDTKAPTFPIG